MCSHKSDIWAIGCVAYELLAHRPPFVEPSLLHKVLTAEPHTLPESYSTGLRGLVSRTLKKDPRERPGSTELLQDEVVLHHLKTWDAAAHSTISS